MTMTAMRSSLIWIEMGKMRGGGGDGEIEGRQGGGWLKRMRGAWVGRETCE